MVAMAQGSTSRFTGAINGLVTDEADGSPIPGAVVRIVSVNTGREWTAQTSSAGTFVFDLITPDQYNIDVTCPGYEVNVNSNDKNFLVEFKLSKKVQAPRLQLRRIGAAGAVPDASRPSQPADRTRKVPVLPGSLAGADGTRGLSLNFDYIRSLPIAGLRTFDQLAF
ncbi:MAG: carboxypeptidase regulatory-like domain-containing protein, partial [Acidobacteria bacterium]|nr:carboxypeptidase regulatory-like domain-containing protein [Acidobacteriota bacterium]